MLIKINKHIEIVSTNQAGLSSMSEESRDAILAVLAKHYTRVGITLVNNIHDLKKLVAKAPDLVFLGMKFIPVNPELGFQDPDKIWLSDYFDANNIAYTGSSQMAHELELNKPLAKKRVIEFGLNTSPFYVARRGQKQDKNSITLNFPVFIKPADRGGGSGVDDNSVAHNFDEARAKIRSIATEFKSDSLVEEYLPGREFSVAILKDEYSEEFSVMPIELTSELNADGHRMLSSQVKSSNAEGVLEVSDQAIRSKVSNLAINVFQALGGRDYGRIDIRIDKKGMPQFLEANLLPSLISGYGSFPKACLLNLSLDYESMILTILRLALARTQPDIHEDLVFTDAIALPA